MLVAHGILFLVGLLVDELFLPLSLLTLVVDGAWTTFLFGFVFHDDSVFDFFLEVDVSSLDALFQAHFERLFDLAIGLALDLDWVVIAFKHVHGIAVC